MDLEYKFGIMDQNFRVSEIVMILKGLAEWLIRMGPFMRVNLWKICNQEKGDIMMIWWNILVNGKGINIMGLGMNKIKWTQSQLSIWESILKERNKEKEK